MVDRRGKWRLASDDFLIHHPYEFSHRLVVTRKGFIQWSTHRAKAADFEDAIPAMATRILSHFRGRTQDNPIEIDWQSLYLSPPSLIPANSTLHQSSFAQHCYWCNLICIHISSATPFPFPITFFVQSFTWQFNPPPLWLEIAHQCVSRRVRSSESSSLWIVFHVGNKCVQVGSGSIVSPMRHWRSTGVKPQRGALCFRHWQPNASGLACAVSKFLYKTTVFGPVRDINRPPRHPQGKGQKRVCRTLCNASLCSVVQSSYGGAGTTFGMFVKCDFASFQVMSCLSFVLAWRDHCQMHNPVRSWYSFFLHEMSTGLGRRSNSFWYLHFVESPQGTPQWY